MTLDKLLNPIEHQIKLYGDVIPVLKNLSKKFNLIIISHAHRNLLDLKLNKLKINKFFSHTFSTISDFGVMNKSAEVYKKISEILNVPLQNIVHIGDDYQFDYQVPMSMGIRCFLIDRKGSKKEYYIVRNLFEFEEKLF
ncbi:MAG: HAD family hydrolase [Candidatus Aenigmatarchaeota archaeon]